MAAPVEVVAEPDATKPGLERSRPAGSVLIEQHDEWEAGERRYFSEASMLELTTMNHPIEAIDEAVILPELAAA